MMISQAITNGRLSQNTQLLVRMHPNSQREEFKDSPHTVFHRPAGIYFNQGRLSDMEFNQEWLQELMDSLFYSDVTINAQSTMSIDASAFDKPIINLAFDGYEKLPYIRSVRRLYDIAHYQPILKSGGVRLVYSETELLDWLNRYLVDPTLDRAGRQRILTEQGGSVDGGNGRRTADCILEFLKVNIDK